MGKKGIPHRKWSKEEKMKIIKLHLEEHIPVCEIERQYSISNSLVCAWVKKYITEGEDALEPRNGNPYVGPSRCGSRSLGSLMLGREKCHSFCFPACSLICSRCFTAFSSSSICVRVGSCASSSLIFFR